MSLLDQLAANHDKLIAIAKQLTKGSQWKAEELVQEFYLAIAEKNIKKELKIKNLMAYAAQSLYNLHYDLNYRKIEPTFIQIDSDDNYFEIEEPCNADFLLEESEFEVFFSAIEKFLKEDYRNITAFYKVGLLKLNYGLHQDNYNEPLSLQKISNYTGITKRKVQLSVEHVKKLIKDQFMDEYNEYIKTINNG